MPHCKRSHVESGNNVGLTLIKVTEMLKEETTPEVMFAETIDKIKSLLKGKSYSDISDILIHVQSSITEETIY